MQKSHADRVAAAVRAEVARRKVTQQQLAELLGVHQMSVSRRLNGQTPFTAAEILTVAEFLGCDPALLMPTQDVA
jgi:transcriptional regulator with XRE-family HTH domain